MSISLYKAFSQIRDEKEFNNFVRDLCTPSEIQSMKERWLVAQTLYEGKLSYREIEDQVGSSLATITRVARFLKDEPHRGYSVILDRLKKKKARSG